MIISGRLAGNGYKLLAQGGSERFAVEDPYPSLFVAGPQHDQVLDAITVDIPSRQLWAQFRGLAEWLELTACTRFPVPPDIHFERLHCGNAAQCRTDEKLSTVGGTVDHLVRDCQVYAGFKGDVAGQKILAELLQKCRWGTAVRPDRGRAGGSRRDDQVVPAIAIHVAHSDRYPNTGKNEIGVRSQLRDECSVLAIKNADHLIDDTFVRRDDKIGEPIPRQVTHNRVDADEAGRPIETIRRHLELHPA